MTGAAIAIGIANIVMSARNRRSRTSRRLVDSPRRSSGAGVVVDVDSPVGSRGVVRRL